MKIKFVGNVSHWGHRQGLAAQIHVDGVRYRNAYAYDLPKVDTTQDGICRAKLTQWAAMMVREKPHRVGPGWAFAVAHGLGL